MRILINGNEVDGRAGEMILDLARRENIEIPALCAEQRLEPVDSCGVCVVEVEGKGVVKSCSTPIEEGMVILTRSAAAEDVRKAALELLLSNHWGDCLAPCKQACPAHTDCQAYVSLAGNGRFQDALKILYENIPLPATFGRVCPAPCEDACRREIAEEPVQIRHMKRFLGDLGLDYVPSVASETGNKIAIVGGGPAGLSVAYFLRRHGHGVIVFDAMPQMGGMLRYGIPEYRLSHAVLDRDINVLQRMGIVFRNNIRLGQDVTCVQLEDEYDAVFLGLGAWGTRSMGVPGEDNPAVIQGTDFLRDVNSGQRPSLPDHVVVIGGGNTAMDAARCARRLGAEVTVLYRRSQEEMPALEYEVEEAEEEGVKFQYLTQPVEFIGDSRALSTVRCVRMKLGQPDDSGRRRPVPVEGSEFAIDVRGVMLAVGQTIDTRCLADSSVEVSKWGNIVADETSGATSSVTVFAGGDVVTGPSIAVEAVGAGHRAADAIHRFLESGSREEPHATYNHVKHGVTREDIGSPATSPQIRTPVRSVEERLADFEEYETELSEEQAEVAGQRCLECGCMAFADCSLRDYATESNAVQETYEGDLPHKRRDDRHPFIVRKVGKCIACGRCIRTCAEVCGISAIDFVGRGINVEVQVPFNRAWQDSDCVSCGACVDVCPTGALYDRSVLDKQVPLVLEHKPTTCLLCGVGCDIEVLSLDGTYMRTEPADGSSVLCARGRYGWHSIKDIPRITEPMILCGTAHVRVSWDEALSEIAERLGDAKGSITLFGTGLLTCEEGWLVARLAEGLNAGGPIFDFNASRSQIDIRPEQIASIEDLKDANHIMIIGPRSSQEKVALDAILRTLTATGTMLVSVGAQIVGASREMGLETLQELLASFDTTSLFDTELSSLVKDNAPYIVVEERTVTRDSLGLITSFLDQHENARLVVVSATANARGLRRLGFTEELRTSSQAWLAIGVDPMATPAGRRYQLDLETMIAMSPVPTETTKRAHVILPMRLPLETRGHILQGDKHKSLEVTIQSPLLIETWEVLLRIASAVGIEGLPWQFDALSHNALCGDLKSDRSKVAAGTTEASLASIIDTRLDWLGIRKGV